MIIVRKIKTRPAFLMIVSACVFGVIGIALLMRSSAIAPVANIEPEKGSLSGSVVSITDGSASNGSAVTFGSASANLPFDLPSQDTLKSSSKKVFAHYFTPYPLSKDNLEAAEDYYTLQYLSIDGENGKHAAYGGFLRSRPLPVPVSTSPDWFLENMKTEVRYATEAGLDGFTADMLGLSGYNWDRLNVLLEAAPLVDQNFKIMLMPDSNSTTVKESPQILANAIAGLYQQYPQSLFKLDDGRLVISPFAPEKLGVTFWADFINEMKNTHGIDVAFVPCFLDYYASRNDFASISYGFSHWGARTPAQNYASKLQGYADDAHAKGKIWMQPVSVQDQRPYTARYDESNNTENLRMTWDGAINNAEWVQIPTWNDYSEGTEIAPSSQIGWSPLDISAYYLTRFKTGSYPTITRDVAYLSHREQFFDALPDPLYPTVMVARSTSSPPRDTVEVLSFFTQPKEVTVTIGGATHVYTAPAGVYSQLYPLEYGQIEMSFSDGSATRVTTSSTEVKSLFNQQDLQYHYFSSARDGVTQ